MSKQIPLTQGQFAIVDDKNFEWLNQWKWYALKSRYTFYAVRNVGKHPKQTLVLMHRQIMNAHKEQEIDHHNGNGLDNHRINLRFCASGQNNQNQRKTRGTSKYKGVSWHKNIKQWRVSIQDDYKTINLGYFDNEEDAARAYDQKAKELFGEFANTNF